MIELNQMLKQFVTSGVLTEEAVNAISKEFDLAVREKADKELFSKVESMKAKLLQEAKEIAMKDIRKKEIDIVASAEKYIKKNVQEQLHVKIKKLDEQTKVYKNTLEEQVISSVRDFIKTEIMPDVNKVIVEESISRGKSKLLEESLVKDQAIAQLTEITNRLTSVITANKEDSSSAYLRKVNKIKTIEEELKRDLQAETNKLSRGQILARMLKEEGRPVNDYLDEIPEDDETPVSLGISRATTGMTHKERKAQLAAQRAKSARQVPTPEMRKTLSEIVEFDRLIGELKGKHDQLIKNLFGDIFTRWNLKIVKSIWEDKMGQRGYPVIADIIESPFGGDLIDAFNNLKNAIDSNKSGLTYNDFIEMADEYLAVGGGSGGLRIPGMTGKSAAAHGDRLSKMSDDELDKMAMRYARKSGGNTAFVRNSDARNEKTIETGRTARERQLDESGRRQSRLLKEQRRIRQGKLKMEQLKKSIATMKEEEKQNLRKLEVDNKRRRSIIQEARDYFIKEKTKDESRKKLLQEQREVAMKEKARLHQESADRARMIEENRKREMSEKVQNFVEESVKGLKPEQAAEVKRRLKGKKFNDIKTNIRSVIRLVIEEGLQKRLKSNKSKDSTIRGKGLIQEDLSLRRMRPQVDEIDPTDPFDVAGSLV